ncbi:MAG: hypothetical protein JWO62_2984 [Acidimicrobiaceae bacterium]|jgi:hypothetical protein|nr:hypothetical protein [Acidimicrobiaceae bacterium]
MSQADWPLTEAEAIADSARGSSLQIYRRDAVQHKPCTCVGEPACDALTSDENHGDARRLLGGSDPLATLDLAFFEVTNVAVHAWRDLSTARSARASSSGSRRRRARTSRC